MWITITLAAGLMGFALASEGEEGPMVLSVSSKKAGFTPHQLSRSMQQGRPHDPHRVVSVEVTLGAKTTEALQSQAAFTTAVAKARESMPSAGWPRRVSGIVPSRRFDGFEARFEVS
jgi:hypothetical protein